MRTQNDTHIYTERIKWNKARRDLASLPFVSKTAKMPFSWVTAIYPISNSVTDHASCFVHVSNCINFNK